MQRYGKFADSIWRSRPSDVGHGDALAVLSSGQAHQLHGRKKRRGPGDRVEAFRPSSSLPRSHKLQACTLFLSDSNADAYNSQGPQGQTATTQQAALSFRTPF